MDEAPTTNLSKDVINQAMEQAAGEIAHAAVLLRCRQKRLEQAIEKEPELYQRWVLNRPKSSAEAIRKIAFQPLTAEDVRKSVEESDEAFQRKLKTIGMTEDQAAQIRNLQGLAHGFFRQTVEFLHGGLVEGFADLTVERKTWLAMLGQALQRSKDYDFMSAERNACLAEARMIGEMLRKVGTEILEANTVVQNSLFVVASQHRKKASKPGFKDSPSGASESQ